MKQPCPKCREKGEDRTGDNLEVYPDGSAYCFACGHTIHSEHIKGGLVEKKQKIFTKEDGRRIWGSTSFDMTNYRGISVDANKFYGVRTSYNEETGEVSSRYYPVYTSGSITGYKVRSHPKNIYSVGNVGKGCMMFGQAQFKDKMNYCLIVEGEEDTLAAYEMLNRQWNIAVVSPAKGVNATVDEVKDNYEFFNQFSTIVVGLDADDIGQEFTQKIAALLPIGKVKTVKWRYKDPNDYLLKGEQDKFTKDFWNAEEYCPTGIVGSGGGIEELVEFVQEPRFTLPAFMDKAQRMTGGGLCHGIPFILAAGTGQGKSTVLNEMIIHSVLHDQTAKVCVLQTEGRLQRFKTDLLSSFIGKDLFYLPVDDRLKLLGEEWVQEKYIELFGTKEEPTFHIIDHKGGMSIEQFKEKMDYPRAAYGSNLLFIDTFTSIMGEHDTKEIYELGNWIIDYTNRYKVTVGSILQLRKALACGKPASLGGIPIEEDILGPGSLIHNSDTTMLIYRTKDSDDEEEKNIVHAKLVKNRSGRLTGKCGPYKYNREKHKLEVYVEQEDY